jgi:hypothetical protein
MDDFLVFAETDKRQTLTRVFNAIKICVVVTGKTSIQSQFVAADVFTDVVNFGRFSNQLAAPADSRHNDFQIGRDEQSSPRASFAGFS